MYKLLCVLLVISTVKSSYDEEYEEFWSEPKIVYQGRMVSVKDLSSLDKSIFNDIEAIFFDDNGTIPKEWDWRDKGVIPMVMDERDYYEGYSWAFSAVAGVESHLEIFKNNTDITLSAQNLVDCVNFNTRRSLTNLNFVFNFFIENGTATEDAYPLTGGKGTCELKDDRYTMDFYMTVVDEDHMQRCIATGGPVNALIDASNLASYTGGIIDSSWCNNTIDALNQAVLVVGYGTENDVDYWIIQNSWGENWGENGYFRLEMNANHTCGIGLVGIYPGIFSN